MTGCRHGAKNTLNENYLYLAEKAGAVVHPMTTVVSVTDDSQGGYAVTTLPTDEKRKGEGRTFKARRVVLAAGTYGTQTLLHRMKAGGQLPYLSGRLGELTRTNSEALVGAQTDNRRYRKATGEAKVDFTRGVAITSSIHPDENTHIEPVRYGKGSNSMGSLSILQVPYAEGSSRVLGWLATRPSTPLLVARSLSNRRWSERTIIGLVMQSLDNSLTTYLKPKGAGKGLLTARQGHGAPNPKQIRAASEGAAAIAAEINGFAGSNVGELMGTPLTAHFLGGCPIGASPTRASSTRTTGCTATPASRSSTAPRSPRTWASTRPSRSPRRPSARCRTGPTRARRTRVRRRGRVRAPEAGRAPSPAVPADAFGALRLPFLGMPTVPPKK
jgi:cholesterol oxidase